VSRIQIVELGDFYCCLLTTTVSHLDPSIEFGYTGTSTFAEFQKRSSLTYAKVSITVLQHSNWQDKFSFLINVCSLKICLWKQKKSLFFRFPWMFYWVFTVKMYTIVLLSRVVKVLNELKTASKLFQWFDRFCGTFEADFWKFYYFWDSLTRRLMVCIQSESLQTLKPLSKLSNPSIVSFIDKSIDSKSKPMKKHWQKLSSFSNYPSRVHRIVIINRHCVIAANLLPAISI
jgi:hypothetical protein